MNLENRLSKMIRRSQPGVLAVVLASALATVACEESDFCAEDGCADDAGGEPGADDDDGASGGKGSGGKGSGGKNSGKGSGGLGGNLGSGGKSGTAGGDSGSGGKKANGSGGQPEAEPDPGAIDGRVKGTLFDVLPGGTVDVNVLIERQGAFEGTVLVSLKDSDEFTGTRLFAAPKEDEVSLKVAAAFDLEQGYYDATILAESSDGSLSVEIPVTFRVRGAPGTRDLTFGDRESPWMGTGYEARAAVDDAGFVYFRNEKTLIRFDREGRLDESFSLPKLQFIGPMIGMEDGVLAAQPAEFAPYSSFLHIRGSGARNAAWTGIVEIDYVPLEPTDPQAFYRRGDQVLITALWEDPGSHVQLFEASGPAITSFRERNLHFHSYEPTHARIDSQGRVIYVREEYLPKVRRLLPDGSVDASFAKEGDLHLGDTTVIDFDVLSDDGFVLLLRDSSLEVTLAVWTPSDADPEGIMTYHPLPPRIRALQVLEGDRLLTIEDDNSRHPVTTFRMFDREGQAISSFGESGAANVSALSNAYYAPLPAFDRFQWEEPVWDKKANRLIAYGTDLGKTYLFSIWL